MAIESRLHIILAERRLNIRQFADIAGLHYSTAHGMVQGENKAVRLDVLNQVCAALDVQPGDIFIYVPDPPAQ